jgi:hypothetical protein
VTISQSWLDASTHSSMLRHTIHWDLTTFTLFACPLFSDLLYPPSLILTHLHCLVHTDSLLNCAPTSCRIGSKSNISSFLVYPYALITMVRPPIPSYLNQQDISTVSFTLLFFSLVVMFLLDVCPTWTRGVALVDLLQRSVLHCDKPWDTR